VAAALASDARGAACAGAATAEEMTSTKGDSAATMSAADKRSFFIPNCLGWEREWGWCPHRVKEGCAIG